MVNMGIEPMHPVHFPPAPIPTISKFHALVWVFFVEFLTVLDEKNGVLPSFTHLKEQAG